MISRTIFDTLIKLVFCRDNKALNSRVLSGFVRIGGGRDETCYN